MGNSIDLQESGSTLTLPKFEVGIIGAGAAGVYLAKRLSQCGLDVAIVEAGTKNCKSLNDVGFETDFINSYYPGAVEGRAFGIGGSTSRWGGLLVPHSKLDSQAHDSETVWKNVVTRTQLHSKSVLQTLGYHGNPDFESFHERVFNGIASDFQERNIPTVSSLFLPFRKKNLARLAQNVSDQSLTVIRNAVASEWKCNSSGQVVACKIRSLNGSEYELHCDRFVIAAGAIESARILLEIQDQNRSDITLSADIGRNLGDHLSIAIADVPMRLLHDFVPRFEGDWMRTFRFLTKSELGSRRVGFAHFIFENDNAGFLLAKECLSALQAKRFPKISLADVIRGSIGIPMLGYHRFVKRRLYIPEDTNAHLQLDMEQHPHPENKIFLTTKRDTYGRKIPAIHWAVTNKDLNTIKHCASTLIDNWNSSSVLPRLKSRSLDFENTKPHDAYHPVGVCRMGDDANAVVDHDMRVNGLKNVWCITTGVFPTAGTANPTFSMLCLAEQLVSDLSTSVL